MSKTLNGVPFRQIWLPEEKYSIKAPFAMVWKKLTLHETDNMMDALREIRYMISNTNQTSYHIAADENEIIQAIPFNRNAWHSGDGLNGYGNRNTIGWEMCRNYDRNRQTTQLLEPLSSQYKRTVQNTIKGAAQLFVNEGRVANNDNIKTHFDWSGKHCPRKARNDGQVLIIKAGIINEYNRLKGIQKKPVAVQTSKKEDAHLTFRQVVDKASAGGYGNYPERVKAINDKTNYTYDVVQPEINKRFNVKTPVKPQNKPTAEQVANDIAFTKHKWGNNPERARRLRAEGYDAGWIQRRVDDIILGTNKASTKKVPVSSGTISVGSKVLLKTSASRYATGEPIPAGVKGKTYTVQERSTRSGKRQVLLQEIVSWVWESDVTLQANVTQAKPQIRAKTLHLPQSATSWRIYRPEGPYVAGSRGELPNKLAPSLVKGGLYYTIQKDLGGHVYLINTRDFGRVAIYAHPTTGATIK